jgi:cell division protein FtsB
MTDNTLTIQELKISFYDTLQLIQQKQSELNALTNYLKSLEEEIQLLETKNKIEDDSNNE